MSSGYLKRWRKYRAEVEAIAQPGSSDEDHETPNASDISERSLTPPGGAQAIVTGPDFSSDHSSRNNSGTDSDHSDTDGNDTTSDSSVTSVVESDFDEVEEGNVLELGEELSMWATKNKCSRSAVNEMLDMLRRHGHRLPKDSRTLLNTPRVIVTEEKCGGQYIYIGIETGLLKIIAQHPRCFRDNAADLNFNIDGVPLFKSSNTQLWPILCSVKNFEPFIVALFYGNSKPKSVEDYLFDFLMELTVLRENGLTFNEEIIQVNVNAFVCDAPARAFLKCTKAHNAYYSCERCIIKGHWNGRVVFDLDGEEMPPLRTEECLISLKDHL